MGPVALAFVLGASLVHSSMAAGSGAAPPRATLNRRSLLTVQAVSDLPRYSVHDVPASLLARLLTEQPARRATPDGVAARGVIAVVGRVKARPLVTNAVTVGDLLQALRVRLARTDKVLPQAATTLWTGIRVRVVRIRSRIETVSQVVPFQTLIQYSRELGSGEAQVLRPGAEGLVVLNFRVTYRNGREVKRVLLSQDLESPSTPRLELRGVARPGPSPGRVQDGQASWYDCSGNFAAHLTLPKGTAVKVTNVDNGRSVTVIIDDRGPYGIPGRIIDLCSTAFAQIAPLGQGVANVEITW